MEKAFEKLPWAKEMIEECGSLDAVLSPIGGGGLMSGTCISTRSLLPDALIFGTEPEGADGKRA